MLQNQINFDAHLKFSLLDKKVEMETQLVAYFANALKSVNFI